MNDLPKGLPDENSIKIIDTPYPSDQLNEGEVLIQLTTISVDPYQRVRMTDLKGGYF